MSFHKALVSFNAGEASPLLRCRSDLEKYSSLCQRLENFLILPYGGALRRPGTEYLGNAKFDDKRCRLVSFNFSTTTNFILEFGNLYVRFWSNGIQVLGGGGHPLELPTSYLEADLLELQFCQVNDLVYIVHPDYAPSKLQRLADDNWTFEEIEWDFPPCLDENETDLTLNPSGTTGSISISASSPIFQEGHIGSYWTIGYRRETAWVKVDLDASDHTSSILGMIGQWELTTYGNWQGSLFLERQLLGSSIWEVMREWVVTSEGSRNYSSTGREENICGLRLRFDSAGAAGTLDPEAVLELSDNRYFGFVKITGFTSDTLVSADVISDLYTSSDTKLWQEAAFSGVQGYPRTVCLHDSRLMFAGTRQRPLSIHGSTIEDFEDFRPGSIADNAIFFTIASNESNPINWMISQQGVLLIGNAGEEWTIERSDDQEALSATNVRAIRQSSYGSAYVQARLVNEVVLFIQRQGRKVRELTFAFEKDGWVAPDLTILAPHITSKGVVEAAFQQQPDAIFWIITSDGKMAGMTYERDQNVVGWHPHFTDGQFESVAAIYGGSDSDEVWFSVKRTINGETKRYIERLYPDHRDALDDEDKDNWWYLDCAKRTISGSPISLITGLGHLEGKTVRVLADGGTQADQLVSSGQITLQTAAENILVGLPYTSVLRPMDVEIQLPDGSIKSRRARIHRIAIQVYKSIGCEFSPDESSWDEIFFRDQSDPMDTSLAPFTGKKKVSVGGSFEDFAQITLRTSKPLPLCILGITPVLDFYGSE